MPNSDEGIKLGLVDDKVCGTLPENVDGITLGLDVGTDPGSLDGSFYNIRWLLWRPKTH